MSVGEKEAPKEEGLIKKEEVPTPKEKEAEEVKVSSKDNETDRNEGVDPVASVGEDTNGQETLNKNENPMAEEEEAEEIWDILQVTNDRQCRMDNCDKKSVSVWASSADPKDEWSMCEACQESEFGGWPVGMEPSTKVPADTESTAEVPSNETNDDEEEDEEVWDLKLIVSKESLEQAPIKCSTEKCMLPAACAYVSNLAPSTKWYTCLDCQVSELHKLHIEL